MISSRFLHTLDIVLPICERLGILPYHWNLITHRLEITRKLCRFHFNAFLFLLWIAFIARQLSRSNHLNFGDFNLIMAFSIVALVPLLAAILFMTCRREIMAHINGFLQHCTFITRKNWTFAELVSCSKLSNDIEYCFFNLHFLQHFFCLHLIPTTRTWTSMLICYL